MSIKKIAIIGPESTGKSTLAAGLAAAHHTLWVPEYAREYLEQLGRPYVEADLLEIAKGQLQSEDESLPLASRYLICDTDLHVIKVWSEHKYGRCHPAVIAAIATRRYDLYLVTDIDLPWQPDPLREHPDTDLREYFFNIYKALAAGTGVPYAIISGDREQRLQLALAAVSSL